MIIGRGKRIVPKDMPMERRKEYRELMKAEYITLQQEIKNVIQKRSEVCQSLLVDDSEHFISYVMPNYIHDDEKFQEWVKNGDMNATLYRYFKELTPREYNVISLRFGINCSFNHTLDEAAKIFSVTRERLRQIETKALKKLRMRIKKEMNKDQWPTFGTDEGQEWNIKR